MRYLRREVSNHNKTRTRKTMVKTHARARMRTMKQKNRHTLSNFSGMSSSSVGCSRSGSVCCRDLLCCSRFSWAWAACCLSSSAFLRCFRCLFLNFFSSDGAKFSANRQEERESEQIFTFSERTSATARELTSKRSFLHV